VNGTDAVNVDQLKAQETTLGNKGLNFSANSGPAVHKNLGDTLGVIGTGTKADSEYSGENVKTITDANGNIVVQLDKNLTADSLTINGKPGVNGQPGTPGLSITGAQGPAGVNGQPGEVTTRIEYNDGTGPQQVANLNDGLKFAGNQGSTINKKLNETLSIKGDLANADAATATNLRVDEENGELKIKLARNLTDLDSVTVGNTVLNPNGLTVGGPTGPSITTNGINAGDKAITNVAPGVNGTDAVNVDQLKAQETTLGNKGLNFSANSGAAVHKNLGDTLGVIGTGTKADSEYSGENVKTITDANGNIVVQLDKNLTADSLTINGKPGVNGQPGTPGLSITGAQGPAGVNGQPGEVTTRIEYNDGTGPQQVANLNDGLKFAGNQGSTINKKLNETLSIKGDLANADAATATNLRVDEENGELKIKLARNLTDLDSVTVGNTVLNPNGLTVGGPTGPSITTNGINAGDKAITNVAPGVNGTDAVNVDQLKAQETTLGNKGLNFSANSGAAVHKNLGDTLGVIGTGTKADSEYSGENVKTITDANGNIVVQLDKNLTADSLTINGKPGVNGQPGTPGLSITGAQGPAGVNGQPGEVTTRIEYNDGTGPQQVANLNDGLKFAGNQGSTINKKLNETLSIKGDLANADAATATNLRVDEENGELKIKLARNLTDLDSVTVGNTVLNPNGLTVGGPTGPSITTNGINAGDKAITNVAPGVNGTDAVNVDQLKAQETTLGNKGLNFSANSGAAVHKNLGDTLGVIGTGTKADSEYSGENVKTITDANGNIVVQLDKNLTADSLTINGKPGVNGQPGTPGLSITGAQGPAGVNGQPGEVTTRIEYNDGTGPQQVANLNDGLKFAGNQGSTINKKLNETLSIKGDLANADAATATNLRVDEENGELKIKLARNLTDLDSVTVGNTVLNPNGLTVGGPTGPSITTNGINAGDKAITNVAPGVNGTDAVNVDQLKAQETTLGNKGLNFSANSGAAVHKNLGDTLGVIGTGTKADSEYSGENVKTITDANGNIVVQLDKNLTADSLTINGKPGVNGQPGTPGLSITGAQGPAGVNGQPGEVTTRIEYNDGTGPQQVANLNDGLKFAGNQGSTINKKLNETLSIKGDLANADAATATNLRVDEENGELKIKLARNLTDLDSVTVGNTVLNPNGLTVGGPTGPSITTNGINAGDKAITNVAPGVNGTDAVNVDQLTKQTAVATTEVKAADGDKNISVDKVTAKDGHSIYNVGVSRDLNVDTVTLPNIDGSSTKLSANGLSFVDIAGNPTGPMVTANGIDAGNQKITNVAPAIISKESKDAVNGSQLYNLGNNINNIWRKCVL
jgi:autotransporter adhesin